jgi:hypothetical protein
LLLALLKGSEAMTVVVGFLKLQTESTGVTSNMWCVGSAVTHWQDTQLASAGCLRDFVTDMPPSQWGSDMCSQLSIACCWSRGYSVYKPHKHHGKSKSGCMNSIFNIVLYLEKRFFKKHLKIQDKVMVTYGSFNLILLGHFYI